MIHTVYLYIRDYIFIYVTCSQTSIYWIIGLCSQISFAALRLQLPVCTAIGHVENHGKKKKNIRGAPTRCRQTSQNRG